MDSEIISVGTELLLGNIVNTNARFLASQLSYLGINVYRQTVVGDNFERLYNAISEAFNRVSLIVATGGLGPTGDDITKETVSRFFDAPLLLHKPSLDAIESFFKTVNRPMTKNNEKQAYFPEGAHIFQNENGMAPGFALSKNGKTILLLPGPPSEAEPMFTEKAVPYLAKLSSRVIRSHEIFLFGIGESAAEALLADLMEKSNPSLAPYAKTGELLLRATAKADTSQKAEELLSPLISEVKRRLKSLCYGVDCGSLEGRSAELLKEKNLTVSFAESCTGGLLSKRITDIPGASQVFKCSAVTYSNQSKNRILSVPAKIIKKYGAVSKETAICMAKGAAALCGSDIGIGITGIAGPKGGTKDKPVGLVYTALYDGKMIWYKKLCLGAPGRGRDNIRYIAASYALDMLRRYLENLK